MIKPLSDSAIIFDLDGTLVETAPDLHGALVHVLTEAGLPQPTLNDVRLMVGDGARALIERAYAAAGAPIRGDALEAAMSRFLAHYGPNVARLSRTFPGVEKALDRFAAAGAALGVCTNKPQALSQALLDALGLSGRLPVVVGGDALAVKKPDPAHLAATIERMGRAGRPAVMVGDSRNDVAVAKALGIPAVVVSFGYTVIPPAELGADIMIDHFDELPAALHTLGFRD